MRHNFDRSSPCFYRQLTHHFSHSRLASSIPTKAYIILLVYPLELSLCDSMISPFTISLLYNEFHDLTEFPVPLIGSHVYGLLPPSFFLSFPPLSLYSPAFVDLLFGTFSVIDVQNTSALISVTNDFACRTLMTSH